MEVVIIAQSINFGEKKKRLPSGWHFPTDFELEDGMSDPEDIS